VRHLEGITSYAYEPNGEISRVIGIYKDVTDRVVDQAELKARDARLQTLQAELTQVARLSAMGEMAAALAHELNQPLTAVGASVGAIGIVMSGDAPIEGAVRQSIIWATTQAEAQAVRAGEIVRRLRNFIARDDADAQIEDLEAVIDDSLALALPGRAADSIKVRRSSPATPTMVLADRVQIQQILVNLIRNAAEAMGHQTTARVLTLTSEIEGEMAVIRVADTGPGVSAEVVDRLFTPFTSTKRDGMGVGLSICRRIAEAHHGVLSLERTDSLGTTFRLTLPLQPEVT
jgi:two-component system sensor kinase FixL